MYQVLDRCLALEAEVAQIPALRRQLDSYRRSKTDMEVASREQVSSELDMNTDDFVRLPFLTIAANIPRWFQVLVVYVMKHAQGVKASVASIYWSTYCSC